MISIYQSERRPPARTAFTLIELLVVVSIIALLIGILLPALGQARDAGRTTACLSNMRQTAISTVAYALDHRSKLPSVGFSHGGAIYPEQGSWFFLLESYASGKLHYRCPTDNSIYWDQPAPSTGRLRRVSFASNYCLGYAAGFEKFASLDALPRPTHTIYAAELTETDANGFATADHIHPETWLGPVSTQDARVEAQVQMRRHQGKANYVLLDGHAATLSRAQTYDRDPSSSILNPKWFANKYYPGVAQ